ncbi:MAG TPA: methyltransferase domain-containing protein [Solirubrobacteraceae bacterium]
MASASPAPTAAAAVRSEAEVRAAIARVKRWYHSIEVAPGVVTPGLFDLRRIAARLPWPDVRGKRCLDVGTADGFLAFELERRGAAEVVALDLAVHEDWDWESHIGELGPQYLRHVGGAEPGVGFRVARELLASSVRLDQLSVYELTPDAVGEFEVVVCGSLLLHLRDPLRALAAVRSVCRDRFLSINQVDLGRSLWARHVPLVRLDGTSGITQWWVPNAAGHRQMLRAAGFAIEREAGLYSIPYGPAHPAPPRAPRWLLRSLARRALTGNDGVTHHAVLGRRA